jgi:hypothetical protein
MHAVYHIRGLTLHQTYGRKGQQDEMTCTDSKEKPLLLTQTSDDQDYPDFCVIVKFYALLGISKKKKEEGILQGLRSCC